MLANYDKVYVKRFRPARIASACGSDADLTPPKCIAMAATTSSFEVCRVLGLGCLVGGVRWFRS